MYSHFIVMPLIMQDWLYVCGEMSWWRGHALVFGNLYTNLPCTNSDRAQQFFTGLGYGGVACVGASAAGCVSSSFCSNARIRSFSCSSAEILWANDSQVNAHWLSMRHSWRGGRSSPRFMRKLTNFIIKWCIIQQIRLSWSIVMLNKFIAVNTSWQQVTRTLVCEYAAMNTNYK